MNQLKALFFFVLSICSLHTAAQRIKGSDTVLPVSQETAEIFMNTHPEQRVTVTGGGPESAYPPSWTIPPILPWLHAPSSSVKNEVESCRTRSKRSNYRLRCPCHHRPPGQPCQPPHPATIGRHLPRKIVNWKQVGGPDMKIIVYSRETSSGTYEFFKESVLKTRTI